MTSQVTRTTDDPPVLSHSRINVIFVTILLGMLLSALDQTIVSTALPTIVGDLGGAAHISWVVTAYMLAETVTTVLAGKFGDLFGRKTIFQLSVAVFIIGSLLCGLAPSLAWLIITRAVQGAGAGGLSVTATALIGDVIPLRERGKYQGAMGAVFGVATVIGPLLGGVFTQYLSWRWAFYVNVPIAIIVIAMAARTIPAMSRATSSSVDYLGITFIGLGATGLTLAFSFGGTTYPWGSPTEIGLFAGSAVALALFVRAESGATDPIIPLRLFRRRVFTVSVALSFLVGFSLFGALTFLPTFLQYVAGSSATESGVRLLPMVIGLLITSVASGSIVGRTGKYRAFPIAGCAIAAVGMYLMSTMDDSTPIALEVLYLFILGAGIGLIMQILTIVVQSTADYRDLGSATSAVTFFRTLGGAFGASVMGTLYANRLGQVLPRAVADAHLTNPAAASNPEALHALPPPARTLIVGAYSTALHNVFLFTVAIVIVGLAVSLLLPQVTLRDTARGSAADAGEGFAMPDVRGSDEQLAKVIGRIMAEKRHVAAREVLQRSGTSLDVPTIWGLFRVYLPGRVLDRQVTQRGIEGSIGVPAGVLDSFFDGIVARGYLERAGGHLQVTAAGRAQAGAIIRAWQQWLAEQVTAWLPDQADPVQQERIDAVLAQIVRRIIREQDTPAEQRAIVAPTTATSTANG